MLHFDDRIKAAAGRALDRVSGCFERIDNMAEVNQLKVLDAFQTNKVSDRHFAASSGYGYGDIGREVIDKVFAESFGSEDALVRHTIISGTHALTIALFGALKPGDTLLSITGKPYDTLEEVIGISGNMRGSLAEYGIKYKQVDFVQNKYIDWDGIKDALTGDVSAVFIQRSKGYSYRPSLCIADIEKICGFVKGIKPNVNVLVDNCYGEFVEDKEPTAVGADLIAGSLIKNPGGGMAETGGYVAGRADLVEAAAYRLYCPGISKEMGASLGQNKAMLKGIFLAPHIVAQAVKTAVFAAALFEDLGFQVFPKYDELRTDIIQTLQLGSAESLIAFCQGIQKGSPVDAFVSPEPWDMPGYSDQVIMAAGTFAQGASIELSADGPLKEPYTAFMQGALTFESGKAGVLLAAQTMLERGLVKL
jgi:cystathionine beta-lyase family protein involved in aluminum resistance